MKNMSCLLAAGLALSASAKEPVDYVNTSIGTISHLLVPCFRTVQLPNAMFRFIPPEHDFTQDRVGPLAMQRPGHRAGGVAGCYPYSGPKDGLFAPWTSTWDQEHATPYAYDVVFDTWDVRFELVPAVRGALAAFSFRRPDEVHAVVLREDEITVSEDGQSVVMKGGFDGTPVHFAGAFDVRPVSVERHGNQTAFVFAPEAKSVKFRYAISYIDAKQAEANLAAYVPDWNAQALISRSQPTNRRWRGRRRHHTNTSSRSTRFWQMSLLKHRTALRRWFRRSSTGRRQGSTSSATAGGTLRRPMALTLRSIRL